MEPNHTAWVEVDTEAIRHNYRQVKNLVGGDVAVMAVIKTNAYGHGLELVAAALANEADWFGVSTGEEGIRARAAAPEASILVFHPVNRWNAEALVAHGLVATVDSPEGARALAAAGRAAGTVPSAHLKVDTGMGRFGVDALDAEGVGRILDTPGVRWEGLYTHFATLSTGDRRTFAEQALRLSRVVEALKTRGALPPCVHYWNSAGALSEPPVPGTPHSMVRCGTLLYGQYPIARPARRLDLRPTWSFCARVVSLRFIPKGRSIGYGAEWMAHRESRIATIPVGYADGFTVEPRSVWSRRGGLRGLYRRLRGYDRVMVQTERGPAPVVGRVAAQSAMLDVTDLPAVCMGDVVRIPARRVLVGEHVPRITGAGRHPPGAEG